ncbi:MAG: hypothetical protein HN576_08945 [Bacteriovoracaceae bacterium]|jgi:hypothetical protein|nr:hypothetical protein [Bacteriovoracaceae bacterium]
MFAITSNVHARDGKSNDGLFSGRVSKINLEAALIRIKIKFTNSKYLNKKDKVEFWTDINPTLRCKGYIAGKSPDYILIKIPDFKFCRVFVSVSNGKYLLFYSEDLKNNILMGKELYKVLLKKQLALSGKLGRRKIELDSHIERVNAVSARYQTLRDKLDAEWSREISKLEDDKNISLRSYKNLEMRIGDVKYKLEQYRIDDDNLALDRWSLDPRLFFKK